MFMQQLKNTKYTSVMIPVNLKKRIDRVRTLLEINDGKRYSYRLLFEKLIEQYE